MFFQQSCSALLGRSTRVSTWHQPSMLNKHLRLPLLRCQTGEMQRSPQAPLGCIQRLPLLGQKLWAAEDTRTLSQIKMLEVIISLDLVSPDCHLLQWGRWLPLRWDWSHARDAGSCSEIEACVGFVGLFVCFNFQSHKKKSLQREELIRPRMYGAWWCNWWVDAEGHNWWHSAHFQLFLQ